MADSIAEKQGTLIDADAALRYVASEAPPMTAEDEKRLVRKIDWSIVPLMCRSFTWGSVSLLLLTMLVLSGIL